jgi:hypothetical protein
MEKQKKSAMIRFPVILLAVSAILLCASPCRALDIKGLVTIPSVEYPDPINQDVVVESGGTLILLDGSVINGTVGVEDGGTLNIEGGYISIDVFVAGGSEVKIKGGVIGGIIEPWDIVVETATAKVTVFGTDFSVENGEIDSSGTFFTPDTLWPPCLLTGTYGGEAGDIDLLFYVYSLDVRIYLAPPESEVIPGMIIDIKPGDDQNNINLKSKGVVPVAVLTTDDFDVATVDPATVEFSGAAPVRWKLEDVDDDGDDDMMFHFRTQDLNLDQDSTEATLTAQLFTQVIVSGTDGVRIVPLKKK